MFHRVISFFGFFSFFVRFIGFGSSFAYQSIKNGLLIFVHRINNFFDRFVFLIIFRLFLRFSFRLFFLCFLSMVKANFFVGVNNRFFLRFFAMHNDRINECAGISAGKNDTYLTNLTMHNISALLFKPVSENRQSSNIAMFDELFGGSTRFCIIKGAISIHTFITVFEQRLTQNIIRIVVLMVPNKRTNMSVIMFERIFHDSPAIRAFEICSCGPTTEIKLFHFDFFLLRQFL